MTSTKILIIDDEALMLEMCSDILSALEFEPVTLQNSLESIETIERERPDIVISDLNMPGMDGMEVLRLSKERFPNLPFIILTGMGTLESAFKAVSLGADDYVTKPFQANELGIRIRQCLEKSKIQKENRNLRQALEKSNSFAQILGSSRAMKVVQSLIERAAPTVANVMIIGESGTGKEMTARAVHQLSDRHDKPFVAVDCVSLPDQLFESELFGHVKGSFTGAIDDKVGLFEAANGGTLFLDEITEMNFDLQGKLLRVLQERKFRRVGGQDLLDLDVRLITATNRNPQKAVDDKRLRLDLYYRLNVIPINLPPLRDRDNDLVELLQHFLVRFSKVNRQPLKAVGGEALDALLDYGWPGNVRELQNLAERLVILATGDAIDMEDLPPEIRAATPADTDAAGDGSPSSFRTPLRRVSRGVLDTMCGLPMQEAKQLFNKIYVERLLETFSGRVTEAAKDRGINRRTIHRIMTESGIDPAAYRKRGTPDAG